MYQYVNLNGNYNGNSGGGFNFKIKKIDLGVNFGFNVNVSRYNNIVSTLKDHILTSLENTTDNNSFGIRVGSYKFKEKKFDFYYNYGINYNTSNSTVNRSVKTNYITQSHFFQMNVQLPHKFEINSNVDANLRQKTNVFTANNNVVLWNAYRQKNV